jgi:hypothetical protein
MDTFFIALPGLLFSSFSALPTGIGLVVAARHMQAGRRSAYLRHLLGSIAAGAVILRLLWGTFFGDDLSGSSTAALAFVFAPIFAAVVQGGIVVIATSVFGKAKVPEKLWLSSRWAIIVPSCLLAVLLFGIINMSVRGNDVNVAKRSSDPQTLHRLFKQSRTGEADSFSVPLFLAQNPNTPPEILVELAKHEHRAVRAMVAQHSMTPDEAIAILTNDKNSFIRELVQKRLERKAR